MTDLDAPVVAGVDGSAQSLAAAEQAAHAALRRDVPLHLIQGFEHAGGYGARGIGSHTAGVPDQRAEAAAMLRDAVDSMRAAHPDLEVRGTQIAGSGGAALVEASRRASLVVVGRRGLGGFAELLLGSVSAQIAAYAHCPVLIVGSPDPHGTVAVGGPVLVGVDGSDSCVPAIEFAFVEAVTRPARLTAAYVYWARPLDWPEPTDGDSDIERQAAEALLARAIAPWTEKYPQVTVEPRLIHSLNPESSLVEASADSALVVVGSRGRGGFKGLLLGSVSQALIHHARCPVAIIHP